MYKVDNAIILAAGTSSRFAPISYEIHKGLIEVKGEVLIERQIRQLKEAGIDEIVIVTGYKSEQFEYLTDKYDVILVHNNEYLTRNNTSSIHCVEKYLKNSYICSADNYFVINPFERYVDESYYSGIYSDGYTKEWCMSVDDDGYINNVNIGGSDAWYMMGHTFWSAEFSRQYIEILNRVYCDEKYANALWEDVFIENLDVLKMKIRKYSNTDIFEFDTLDELREFDEKYIYNSNSKIIEFICEKLCVTEDKIHDFVAIKEKNESIGLFFNIRDEKYQYLYSDADICEVSNK